MYRNQEHLTALANRCDAAATQLTYEGDHAAEVLATRANGNLADPKEWAARKHASAEAVRQYAAELRSEAAGLGAGGRASAERVEQAKMVARGAEMGGILIDGRRGDAAAMANSFNGPEHRHAIAEAARARREAIEGSGLFTHVADEGQVPFWQLGGAAVNSPEQQLAIAEAARARREAIEGSVPDNTGRQAVDADEDCAEA